jgi:hypothetical protein
MLGQRDARAEGACCWCRAVAARLLGCSSATLARAAARADRHSNHRPPLPSSHPSPYASHLGEGEGWGRGWGELGSRLGADGSI